jgi:hypothetical protein
MGYRKYFPKTWPLACQVLYTEENGAKVFHLSNPPETGHRN